MNIGLFPPPHTHTRCLSKKLRGKKILKIEGENPTDISAVDQNSKLLVGRYSGCPFFTRD
jgi:hypothetical protein